MTRFGFINLVGTHDDNLARRTQAADLLFD